MRVNERTDERVAQYYSHYSWLLWTIAECSMDWTSQLMVGHDPNIVFLFHNCNVLITDNDNALDNENVPLTILHFVETLLNPYMEKTK